MVSVDRVECSTWYWSNGTSGADSAGKRVTILVLMLVVNLEPDCCAGSGVTQSRCLGLYAGRV